MEDLRDGSRRAGSTARAARARAIRPPDAVTVDGRAFGDRFQGGSATARDVAHHTAARCPVPLVDVCVAVEGDCHVVGAQQPFETSCTLQERIGHLGGVIRVEREVEERELECLRMRGEIRGKPLVLRTRRRPVIVVIDLVHGAVRTTRATRGIADVRITPGRIQHVDANPAGIECVVLVIA